MTVNRVSLQVFMDSSGDCLITSRAYDQSNRIVWTRSFALSSKDAAKMPSGPFNLGAALLFGDPLP